ncbi:O-acetyltransferase OatA [Botrimarina colliarenosi]|uniref:O-acetyltransferase OatA n=1 Tax=Botrimarina colliarenosi TaxID=2528001 RepID=A0A5C6AJH7_9BACT|nr:acyltransferase [Botrimarina colliarenosi]TWT99637.1 O-acetyltransferase OatA [Botrimarina colliarenosi]
MDGLRGLAIVWVLLHQLVVIPASSTWERLALWPLQFGWYGVTLFFVLSGYLITGVLLDTRDAPNRLSSFYARRALRILPLYFVLVAAVFGVSALAGGALGAETLTTLQAASFWLLLGNWTMAEAGSYLVGPLAVTWSVAIEEQFYLVWPWVVGWFRDRRRLAMFCLIVGLACLGTRLAGQQLGWNPIALYVLTTTRLDALAIGAAAAVATRDGFDPRRWRTALIATAAVAFGLAAGGDLVETLAGGDVVTDWSLGPGITLGAIAGGAVLLLLADPAAAPTLTRWFEARWLRSFGLYSYGIYLTHSPVRAVVRDYVYGPGDGGATPWIAFPEVAGTQLPALLAFLAVCAPLCWLAGVLSYRLIERPCLRLKHRFPARPALS